MPAFCATPAISTRSGCGSARRPSGCSRPGPCATIPCALDVEPRRGRGRRRPPRFRPRPGASACCARRHSARSPDRRASCRLGDATFIPFRRPALIIATWNVNSVRQRLPHLLDYLKEVAPDAICLQEIKCLDEAFPREEIEALGYNIATHGQKTFNGVAILSQASDRGRARPARRRKRRAIALSRGRDPLGRRARCGWRASICRTAIRSATEKYDYKLAFMDRLIRHARKLLAYEEPLVIAGDYNVIPEAARRRASRAMDRRRAVPAADPREISGIDGARASPTRCAPRPTRAGSTRSGTIRPAPGSATTASASTTCCCRRKPPTGWSRATIDKAMRAKEKASDHVPMRIALRE